jgi:hypothetical protein
LRATETHVAGGRESISDDLGTKGVAPGYSVSVICVEGHPWSEVAKDDLIRSDRARSSWNQNGNNDDREEKVRKGVHDRTPL